MATMAITSEQQPRLQAIVQEELERREWAEPGDNVMAEYVTVLLANGNNQGKIRTEMEDLVGADFDPGFLDWLFSAASDLQRSDNTARTSRSPVSSAPPVRERDRDRESDRDPAPHYGGDRDRNGAGSSRLLNSALEQSTKRKSMGDHDEGRKFARDRDGRGFESVPSGPKAMGPEGRGLADRLSGRPGRGGLSVRGQAGRQGGPQMGMGNGQMGMGGFQPGFGPGMMQPGFGGPGFFPPGQQEMMAQMMMMQANMAQMGEMMQQMVQAKNAAPIPPPSKPTPAKIPHGTKLGKHSVSNITPKSGTPGPIPDKPTSKALCRYSVGCSNSRCTFSHPSPVADEKTGMVLSEEPCEAGKNCKDPECVKSHVSPAATLGDAAGPSRLLCKYQNCTNPSCTFRHEDSDGNPIPPPALTAAKAAKEVKASAPVIPAAQSSDNEDNDGDGDVEVVMHSKGLMDGALDDSKAEKMCRYGERCTRPDCKFQHPASRPTPKSGRGGSAKFGKSSNGLQSHTGFNISKKFGAGGATGEQKAPLDPTAGSFVPKGAAAAPASADKELEIWNKYNGNRNATPASPAATSDKASSSRNNQRQPPPNPYYTFPAASGHRLQYPQLWPTSAPYAPYNSLGLHPASHQCPGSSMPKSHGSSRASGSVSHRSSGSRGEGSRDNVPVAPSPSDFPQNTQTPFPPPNLNEQGYPVDPHHPAFFSPAYRPPLYGPGPPSASTTNSTLISPEVSARQFHYPDHRPPGPGAGDYYAPPPIEGAAPYPLADYPNTGTRQWASYRQMPASGVNPSILPFAPIVQEPPSINGGVNGGGGGGGAEVKREPGSRRSTISKPETQGTQGTNSESEGSRPTTAENNSKKGGGKGKVVENGRPKRAAARKESTNEADGEDELEDEEETKVDHRKRKRNRTIRSCVPCHNHKRKTGSCVYEVDEIRNPNDPEEAENDRLLRRIAELEKVVRELRQKRPARNAPAESPPRASSPQAQTASGDSEEGGSVAVPARNGDNKRRRVIVDRFARFKIGEAQMAELTAQAERNSNGPEGSSLLWSHANGSLPWTSKTTNEEPADSNLPECYNAKLEPGHAEKYAPDMLPGEELVANRHGKKAFLGASAGQSHLRRLRELLSKTSKSDGEKDLFSFPEDWAFTGWLPDMRKTFPFTTIWSHENFSGEIISLLPNKVQSHILLESWKNEFAPLFNAWHQPTLEADYQNFFNMTNEGKRNVPLCSLSLYLMICSLGCLVRASRAEMFGDETVDRDPSHTGDGVDLTSSRLQSELYLSGAFHSLRLSSFMSNPTLTGVQAQILLCVYLLVSERVPDCWTQTGCLVRQVIAMGLHVDPLSLDARLSMREAEVRRRIWWSVAGLDALLCVSFGRPSCINYYTTNLPQDRSDANLSDLPGSAQALLPPSNVLRNETTDMTFHAAYFQITIPSYELLDRVFRTDWQYSRSAIYGWFSHSPEGPPKSGDKEPPNTYEDAVRLARDIFLWYAAIPRGMMFDQDEDTAEEYLRTKTSIQINQIFTLCLKSAMLVLVLHRPYLRADPEAYPESTEMCFRASRLLLAAYTCAWECKASICWSFFTVSFRAFHAGAVMAFLAIRQPGTERAKECLAKLRGAIAIFEDRRLAPWKISHPMQADMCAGLVRLDKLATAATQQHSTTTQHHPTAVKALRGHRQHKDSEASPSSSRSGTPLSQIRAFPTSSPTTATTFAHSPSALHHVTMPNEAAPAGMYQAEAGPVPTLGGLVNNPTPQPHANSQVATLAPGGVTDGLRMPPMSGIGLDIGSISADGTSTPRGAFGYPPEVEAIGFRGDGFGAESLTLPDMWASMFGIKMEADAGGTALQDQASHLGAPRWA